MSKGILYLFISLVLFTNTACAEEAKSPVSPVSDRDNGGNSATNNDDDTDDEHLELMSLTYAGKDSFGRSCLLYISAVEEEHDGEHHHEYVAKLDYSIHGQTPLDTIIDFHRYNLDTNTYYSIDSTEPNATPVLAAATLKDEDAEVDLNKLGEYEQNGELVQSLRADFVDMDFDTFKEALDETLEDNAKFETNKSTLDQLENAVLKISHGGHYDAVACSNFSLTEMKEVDFELDGEDHDGDHDHDHDH